jgi:hypothetical protein
MNLNNMLPDSPHPLAPTPRSTTLNPMLEPQTSLATPKVARFALGAFPAPPAPALRSVHSISTNPPPSAFNVNRAASLLFEPRPILRIVSASPPEDSKRVTAVIDRRFMSLPKGPQTQASRPLTERGVLFLVSPRNPLAQDSARIDNSARSLLTHSVSPTSNPTPKPPSISNSTSPGSSPKNLSVSPRSDTPDSNNPLPHVPSNLSSTSLPLNISVSPPQASATPPKPYGHQVALKHGASHQDLLAGARPSNELGADVGAATSQIVRGAPFFISGALALNDYSETQARLGDVSSAVSGVFDALEAINTLNEAKTAKSLLFGMDAAALFISSISKITLGIMSPILGILAMIPSIDLSTAQEAFTACASLLFVTFAIQSMVGFTSTIRNLDLHAHLAYKTLEQKQAYLESFLPNQKLYLEKLIGETLLKAVEQKKLTAADFKEIEHKVLINGFVNLGASLIQGSLSTLTLTSTVLAPALADSVIQAFTFAMGGLFALNAVYDIGATLSGAKNEKVPALQNSSHRWKTAAIAAASTIVGIVLVVVANIATAGTASIVLLVLASILPPLINISYRYASHDNYIKKNQIAPAPADQGIQMVTIIPPTPPAIT